MSHLTHPYSFCVLLPENVLLRILPKLQNEQRREQERKQNLAVVAEVLVQQKEERKQGRRDQRVREAQAVLAAATAAVAASPRVGHVRRLSGASGSCGSDEMEAVVAPFLHGEGAAASQQTSGEAPTQSGAGAPSIQLPLPSGLLENREMKPSTEAITGLNLLMGETYGVQHSPGRPLKFVKKQTERRTAISKIPQPGHVGVLGAALKQEELEGNHLAGQELRRLTPRLMQLHETGTGVALARFLDTARCAEEALHRFRQFWVSAMTPVWPEQRT